MSRGIALVRAMGASVAAVGRAVAQTIAVVRHINRNQPSIRAEGRAFFRQGREDLLATLMGPLAGTTREPGAPGTPTPQQTTASLEGRRVHVRDIERG